MNVKIIKEKGIKCLFAAAAAEIVGNADAPCYRRVTALPSAQVELASRSQQM